MEKIIVKNFLILEDVEMPINKFNLLIGEQASGKSLLSKLVFYFKNNLDDFIFCLVNDKSYDDFIMRLENSFLSIFPSEYWQQNKNFEIKYEINTHYFKITSDDNKNSKIMLELSNEFQQLFNTIKKSIHDWKEEFRKLELQEAQGSLRFTMPFESQARDKIIEAISESEISHFFHIQTFIPSSRSFFANLQKNYWSLTDDILDIDPLIKKFGKSYENTKNLYNILNKNNILEPEIDVSACLNEVIKAEYQEIDGDDWIVGENHKVKLSRASSGQQEAFPMLLILMMNNARVWKFNSHHTYIEEPEAHLFPKAQSKVFSAILKIFDTQKTGFFITTHSPYILTVLNNSVYASELIQQGKLTKEKFFELSNSYPINFDDISAFSIENGRLTNIKDDDLKLIGGEILDSVSHQFGAVYDTLLELDN